MTEGNSSIEDVRAMREAGVPVVGSSVTLAIHQCAVCNRQHDGHGRVWSWRVVNPLPEDYLQPCGLEDCQAVMRGALEREAAKRRQKFERRQARHDRHEAKKVCRSQTGDVRRVLAESEDDFTAADEAALENAECGVRSAESIATAQRSPGERQAEFVAGGKASSANARLVEWWDHVIKTNQVGVFFARSFLKKICGNDYTNNRMKDMREHYEPLGWCFQQAEVSPDGIQPMSSHYRILRKN